MDLWPLRKNTVSGEVNPVPAIAVVRSRVLLVFLDNQLAHAQHILESEQHLIDTSHLMSRDAVEPYGRSSVLGTARYAYRGGSLDNPSSTATP